MNQLQIKLMKEANLLSYLSIKKKIIGAELCGVTDTIGTLVVGVTFAWMGMDTIFTFLLFCVSITINIFSMIANLELFMSTYLKITGSCASNTVCLWCFLH